MPCQAADCLLLQYFYSVVLVFCEAHLLAHRPCYCLRATLKELHSNWHFIQGRSGQLKVLCLTLILSVYFGNSNEVITYDISLGCFTMMFYCFSLHKPGPKWRHLVPLPVSSEEWDEDEESLFWNKGHCLTANMTDRFLKVHSLKRHNGEEFILLQTEQPLEECVSNILAISNSTRLLWIQGTFYSRLTTDLLTTNSFYPHMSLSPPQLHIFALQGLPNLLKRHWVKQARG